MKSPDSKAPHAVVSQPPKPRHWLLDYWELARMHKFPKGTMPIFWPGAWGATMAARSTHVPVLHLAALIGILYIGSVVFHCAACTINDICDVDLDRQVERTKNRPLASGKISLTSAWIFCFLQVGICVALLSLGNKYTLVLGLFGLCPVNAMYPLMKRITYWPQAFLGPAMSWMYLLAWSELRPDTDWQDLVLAMLGNTCWAIVYDTMYGLQDKKDDVDAGVKSTALLFGSWVKPILALFSAGFVGSLVYVGWKNGQGWPFFVVSILGAALHFAWQLFTLDPDDPASCFARFLSNGDLGFIVWAGAALDYAGQNGLLL